MLTIPAEHLPAAVTTLQADEVAYLNVGDGVVFGEPRPDPRHYILTPTSAPPHGLRRHNVHDDVRCGESCGNAPDGARRLIVGSWRALADATCESCWRGQVSDGASFPTPERCPDCRGTSKPIHRLSIRQHPEHAAGGMVAMDTVPGYDPRITVSVDVVVAELVPVIEVPDTGYPPNAPDRFFYVSKAGSLRLVDRIDKSDTYQPITPLGPPLTPGDWVAALERTSE